MSVPNQDNPRCRTAPLSTGAAALIAAALAGVVVLAWAQSSPPDSGEEVRYHLRTRIDLVVVPVTVKDASGELVSDLKREDFQLTENGLVQPIRYFSVDPFPLSAVVLVDEALSASGQSAVREVMPVLATAFGPQDEVALFAFDTYPRQELEFTQDTEQLRQALPRVLKEQTPPAATGLGGGPMASSGQSGPRINQAPPGPGVPILTPKAATPQKCLHDALFAAGMALRGRERGRRRVVFIVSDGLNSRLNLHKYDETRDLLLGEGVSVYAIGVDNARFAMGTTGLSDYAGATGGDVLTPKTTEALAAALGRVTEQARYQYTLAYEPPPAPGAREYRRIEVTVRRSGVKLLAPEGYFAGLPVD
ncbi:MAG: VWA domain-containing protein [Acidobacteria bacterium]|nr:VWA domain-containing protein [Acidobacteriota bacterium]